MKHPTQRTFTRRDALKFLGLAGGAALAADGLLRGADPAPTAAAGAEERPPPPAIGGEQPGFYRFKVGEFEALAVLDGGAVMPADKSPFAVDEAPGAVGAALEKALLPPDRVQLPIVNLVVRTPRDLVLIDAGCGSMLGPVGGRLLPTLGALGLRPEQVTAVIATHAHRDHVGGLVNAEKQPVFPQARIFLGRKEHEFWMASAPDLSGMAIPAESAKEFVLGAQSALGAYKGRLELVAGGDRILEGFELLDTPGHTPGHLSVIVQSGSDQLVHLADVVHHHALTFAHPGWRFAFDADPALAVESRRKLLDRAAADRLRLFGTHLPLPSLGRVRKAATGGAYEFVAEPWAVG